MKRTVITSALLLLTSVSGSGIADNLDLEPCINGAVSSTGRFATQALEDEAIALAGDPRIHSAHTKSDRSLVKE